VHLRVGVHHQPDRFARGALSGSLGTGSGAVLSDVPQSKRVFRVIFCPKCFWQYGAWWPRAEVYGYWGDCPHCGTITAVRSSYVLAPSAASLSASGGRSAREAQTELVL